jgi:hypothetical protein
MDSPYSPFGGLVEIPRDFDCDKFFADRELSGRIDSYTLQGAPAREALFYLINESIAEALAGVDDEATAIAKLAAALGNEHATITTPHPAEIARRQIAARRAARHACTAAIYNGYQP